MTDHKKEAEQLLTMEGVEVLLVAQVHATLALVEQQRIANHLTYRVLLTKTVDMTGWPKESVEAFFENVRATEPTIREGLGL